MIDQKIISATSGGILIFDKDSSSFNLITNIKVPAYKNLNISLRTKWSDEVRDYGNGNNSFKDVILDEYFVVDYNLNYEIF